jgi:acyl-CoA synthetase (NDP forming)
MTARKDANLTSLLYPNSIAVTGASINPEDLGSYILRNIIFSEFKGRVFPVNGSVRELYNFDTYSSIRDIKEDVDLAIIATPSDRVIDDVYDCTRAKVKNICIASKGFAEVGQSGLMLQKKICRMANEAGISVLGPNSLGVISTSKSLNATFGPEILASPPGSPREGKAVFLSQSGALINALTEYSNYYSLGFSEVVGLGNKADISEIDFLQYYGGLREDGRPLVVACYLENIANGKEFVDVCASFTKKIPLVTLIPSESPKTREYIYAHSGNILQKDSVIDLALEQGGAIKVYTQQQLYDLTLAFSWQVLPRGDKVAVISNAGGGLILAIEQIYRQGLKLVNFSTEVKKMLMREIDWKEQNRGVVDLGGSALSLNFLKALDIVLGEHDVNAVVVILSHQVMTDIEESAETIGRLAKRHGKTIIASFMGYDGVEKGIKELAKYFVPAFNSVDRAIYALSKMYKYFTWKEKGGKVVSRYSYPKVLEKRRSVKILEIIERARIEKKVELSLDQCFDLLRHYEISTESMIKVESLKEILAFGKKNKYPLEFYCLKQRKGFVINNEGLVSQVFEDHFKKNKEDEDHKFCDHVVKKLYLNKKVLRLVVQKDTYYEHIDKGFTVKELANLSFGHYFALGVNGGTFDNVVTGLLPLSRDQLEAKLISSRFVELSGLKSGQKLEDFRDNLVAFIQKVVRIPLDFSQIAGIEVKCVVDKGKIIVVDCGVKLDLVV